LIAEPVAFPSELETVTAELQRTKRILTIKETELKAVIAQADEVSHTDALTFLPNRKQIIGDLQREVIFSDRYGTPLTISLLDIDFFKKINDTYGHIVGDDVLRSLGSELRNHIRYPDTIGRYGGEEFLIVLPHSTAKAAMEQAERLCKHVRSLLIKSGEKEIALTISIGIAQYKIHKEDWEAFLSRADAALYQAKNNGRDQWKVSEG
jgi:diguanylate cyclase (GGDEF)-like protein